ncbi:MAG TPA: hypothetical protein VN451_03085 [Chitinophagaceae bacterium]|nr:hypothetical protein [Chitinophagaceae bacterium]
MIQQKEITAVILAGGKSSRMKKENTLGKDWERKMTKEKLRKIYKKLYCINPK